jgi:hypothetical protein
MIIIEHKLVTEHLNVKHARAVLGWSMGAGQTFQWATQFPDFMDIAVPFCGAAKTSLHNQVFLEGVKSALLGAKKQHSAGSTKGGVLPKGEEYRTWTPEETSSGLKAFGRVYAGWGFSQAFYREKLYEKVLGFKDLEDFMVNFWEKWSTSKGMTVISCIWVVTNETRSGEPTRNAIHVASRRLLGARALQRRF